MDKDVIFEKAYSNDKKKLYEPDGEHVNFEVYANEPIKEKEQYSYINKDGYCVGTFFGKIPNITARKVLRRIHLYTGIKTPIFYIYNHKTHILYKYAGSVEPVKKKKITTAILDDGNISIKRKYNFIVHQIEKKNF